MNGPTELGRALRGWRDRLTPEEAGLPAGGMTGGVRRAAGLRREELAQLAGLSVDYLVRLEQGRSTAPSGSVLAALARALRLSAAEREHLYLLGGQPVPGPGVISQHVTPGVFRLLDRLEGVPLSVCDAAWNLVLWNPMWAALMGDMSGLRGHQRNIVWRHFSALPDRVHKTPEERDAFRASVVSDLRSATARYPDDPGLRALVRELLETSEEFAAVWRSGAVGAHEAATKTVLHPQIGPIELDCDILLAPGSDLRIIAYTAPAGSEAAERLKLLGVIGGTEFRGFHPEEGELASSPGE
ncbi:helix-turn-helix domain-containing protein [Phaeacidiphilus oryzae]|uniref:helix-turn-helix domain-containing protein n=1 Tax=Phaeacidiphilus oryzae TaxID=348818 RepID=UPI00068DAD19|nr:helix-turn-helix transcriptional regulator [Phaeacidiphilus oryzae]